MKRYFVTGTDTDCGKTYVTTQLLSFCTNAIAIKPVASGCLSIDSQLISTDAQQLQQKNKLLLSELDNSSKKLNTPHFMSAVQTFSDNKRDFRSAVDQSGLPRGVEGYRIMDGKQPLDAINPWRFKLPVSPHIAAKEEGSALSVIEIADYCMNFHVPGVDTLFIEGAGGLMVPLNDQETWIDFLKQTAIPVILVVGMKLGCINHALLTETALQVSQIKCVGWIANCLYPDMLALSQNISTLSDMLKAPLLAIIPYLGEISSLNEQLL